MKLISRRQFNLLAMASAAAARRRLVPISSWTGTQEQSVETRFKPKLGVTADQAKKVQEEIDKREAQLSGMRSRTLPYGLEPAFVFRAEMARRAPVVARVKAKG